MRMLFVVLDGLGDRPIKELGGLTPLEAARTPHLDALLRSARVGLVHPVRRGVAPESDAGALSLLGYRLPEEGVARGVLEALGAGLSLEPGMLALRANFACVEGARILDRRAGKDLGEEDGRALAEEVERALDLAPFRARVVHTVGHRGVVLIWGPAELSGRITNMDPAYSRQGEMSLALAEAQAQVEPCRALEPEAELSAQLVNRLYVQAMRALSDSPVNERRRGQGKLPVNALLLRDAGTLPRSFRTVNQKFGLSFACVASMPVEKGIAKLLGMELVPVPEEALEEKALRALALNERHDVVYVHVKGPDEFGHRGDAAGKLRSIEEIDARFFGKLSERGGSGSMLITSDHSTPCVLKAHSADPVPAALYKEGETSSDGLQHLSERQAAYGSLGEMEGWQLLPRALELLGLGPKR